MFKKFVLFVVVSFFIVSTQCANNEARKQLAGEPSEFSQFMIPNPVEAALHSTSSLNTITLELDSTGKTLSWEGEVAVDSTLQFTLGVFSPLDLSVTVTPSTLTQTAPVKRNEPFGIDGASYPLVSWTWDKPTPGMWKVVIKYSGTAVGVSHDVVLLVANESPIQVFSHLNTYELQQGQEVGIVANLYDSTTSQLDATGRPTPLILNAANLKVEMEVTFPDGSEKFVPMHDDGLHGDLQAADGIYGAVIQAFETGEYTAQAIFSGSTAQGITFERTTQHYFEVVPPSVTLTGLASVEYNKVDGLMLFHLDVDTLTPSVLKEALTVRAYAEVWGTDQTGLEYVPIAWMQAMVDVSSLANGNTVLTLQLNENWIHKAQAKAPFQLRNIWIEEPNSNVPFSTRNKIFVSSSKNVAMFQPDLKKKNVAITEEMRVGRRPLFLDLLKNKTQSDAVNKLVLVHGYCAGSNPFPIAQFTNAVQFEDFKQKRSNDEFSKKINEFVAKLGITSFGIVSHSQGGLVAVHLHTYYWSGMDNANGGRLIQSVGSPYQGCALAGSLASIGGPFGLGCGSNTDLTIDGAKLWLKGIPPAPRAKAYYYTTTYGTSTGYCVFGANLVASTPNDGTTEIKYATLDGGNNQGTKTNWCHTGGMQHPSQCTDATRNAEMDKLASR